MPSSFSVLFVCLGNICRSPMAEAIFLNEVTKRKLPILVDSAGLGAWHIDEPPDHRTIAEAARHNINIQHYLGRQIQKKDILEFTHIIGMDHQNIIGLKKIAPPDYHQKISLLMDYVSQYRNEAIADPYYGNLADFSKTWEQVSLGCFHLADFFEKQL